MQDDVRRLFQDLGMSDRGPDAETLSGRGQSALARWPLLAATNQALAARARLPASPRPVSKRRRSATIAFTSVRGGAGRSTLAANLSSILAQAGRRSLLVDFDPQGSAGLHFGLEPGQAQGIASKGFGGLQLEALLNRFRGAAACIPFGVLSAEDLTSLALALTLEPGWLQERLEALQPRETELVLVDAPAGPSAFTQQALSAADLVLVVLRPDACSYSTLPALEEMIETYLRQGEARARVRFVINGFDERLDLHRDVLAALHGQLRERLLPFTIRADAKVPEALARRHFAATEASDSPVAGDLRALAEWVQGAADRLLSEAPAPEAVPAQVG